MVRICLFFIEPFLNFIDLFIVKFEIWFSLLSTFNILELGAENWVINVLLAIENAKFHLNVLNIYIRRAQ